MAPPMLPFRPAAPSAALVVRGLIPSQAYKQISAAWAGIDPAQRARQQFGVRFPRVAKSLKTVRRQA